MTLTEGVGIAAQHIRIRGDGRIRGGGRHREKKLEK